jgi:2-phosphoglycerate kinase
MFQVRKKDGSLEDFNPEKVYNSFIAAGLAPADAEDIAKQILLWAEQSDEMITTAEIRKRAIGLMETKDIEAAERYKSYQKPEEKLVTDNS